MKKQTSLVEASVIVGTCPDMCPEKERYRREDTHRLSWFEIYQGSEPRVSAHYHKPITVTSFQGSIELSFKRLCRVDQEF